MLDALKDSEWQVRPQLNMDGSWREGGTSRNSDCLIYTVRFITIKEEMEATEQEKLARDIVAFTHDLPPLRWG